MSQAEIGNLRVRMGLDTAEFNSGVRSVQGSIAGLSSTLKGFATAAAATTLFNATVSAVKAVAEIGDVAESIGVTSEQLQVYQKMAIASGTSTDVLVRGLQTLAEQSVQSGSALEKLFTANGMTLAGKETNEIIREFMTLIQNARTPTEQLAMITEVLGDKVGRQLVEAFRTGAIGVDEATRAMVSSGEYHTNAEVARLQELETRYNEVTDRIATYWRKMVVGIVSGIDAMVTRANAAAADLPKVENGQIQTGRGRGGLAPINFPKGVANNKTTNARTSGFGTMGGPNEFASPPAAAAKPTVRPPPEPPKAPPAPKFSPIVPQIKPGTIDDIYGHGEAVRSLGQSYAEATPEANLFGESLTRIGDTIATGLSDALTGLITGTMSAKEAFAQLAQSVIQSLSDIAAEIIRSGIIKLIGNLLGGMAGGGGAAFNIGGLSFGGVYANGGYLGSGKWGIAGEAGPEIVHGPARITPMDQTGGGVNVTVINNTPAKVNTRQGADGGLTIEVVEDAVATAISRGGNKIDSAMQRGFGLRRAGR